jgi:hypothetical protein
VTGLVLSERLLEHEWIRYDETHRACSRCGLRLFLTRTGWTLLDHNGRPSELRLLATNAGSFGSCTPPPSSGLTVLIDYTGDPHVHPGCERFMHRIPEGNAIELVTAGVVPACGFRPTWWELGPPREWHGWTWCGDCWQGRGRKRRPPLLEAPASTPAPERKRLPKKKPAELGPRKR